MTASWFIPLLLSLATAPTTRPGVGRLPHITVDAADRTVRVECRAVRAEMPLEFLCCQRGSHDYESALTSLARPSDLHLALLMIGLTPGSPARRSDDLKRWTPPHGPALSIEAEFMKDGRVVSMPASQLLRDVKTKRPAPPMHWVFAGSGILPNGQYAADLMGYLVSLVNFDYTLIDVPYIASNSNHTLQWEYNPDTLPPQGTPVTLIIRPMPVSATRPTTRP